MRGCVLVIHADQKLAPARVGQIAQRARHGPAPAIAAAAGLHQPAIINILARDVLPEDRGRQSAPGFIDAFKLVTADHLAAPDAVKIGQDDVDGLDIGVFGKECLGLGHIGAAGG